MAHCCKDLMRWLGLCWCRTIDAIQALTGILKNGPESIAKANAALGIRNVLV